MRLRGEVVDVVRGEVYPGEVRVEGGRIAGVVELERGEGRYILPGLVDAHIHIESSMLVPSRFAEAAVPHGTVGVVADPHEIANVMGMEGVRYMLRDASKVPLKYRFTAPSCVPATEFETSGARLGVREVEELLRMREVVALGELMDFVGVLERRREVMEKIEAARRLGKPVDGHAPGLRGEALRRYVEAGITTDHECTSAEEAEEKAEAGMRVMLREGSAARNLGELAGVARPGRRCFLVSDDLEAGELVERGHVNRLLRRAVEEGIDEVEAVRMASLYPVEHYSLDVGLLREGDPADVVVVDNLRSFRCTACYIDGRLVAEHGRALFRAAPEPCRGSVRAEPRKAEHFRVEVRGRVRVITVREGDITTGEEVVEVESIPAPEADVLKLVVVERYGGGRLGVGAVRGFGLERGAIASSIAHDSHNIIGVGAENEALARAVNEVIGMQGGIAVTDGERVVSLPLPVAGLMSTCTAVEVAERLREVHAFARRLGCRLRSPLVSLSFLALPVIPRLRLTDRGLFDAERFEFTELLVE